jgi:hypothetical protein
MANEPTHHTPCVRLSSGRPSALAMRSCQEPAAFLCEYSCKNHVQIRWAEHG